MKNCPACNNTYPADFTLCPRDGTKLVAVNAWAEGAVIRGKYRILAKLGEGSMGAVYKAQHLVFDELRALKVLSSGLAGDDRYVTQFQQEAIITRKLDHPNAVRVEDLDQSEDGLPFIVMEFIEGVTLGRLMRDNGPLPVSRVCSIVKQVASALAAAHDLGITHRDIKPDNIVLVQTKSGEQAKVLDFGIAKLKDAQSSASPSSSLAQRGLIIGTPRYISPEQARGTPGNEFDGRSDLYSLGVVMYEMLTGRPPFVADSLANLLVAQLSKPPEPVQQAGAGLRIPDAIAGVVMRCLEKNPNQRPPSAHALIEEIEQAEKMIAEAPTPVPRLPVSGGPLVEPPPVRPVQFATEASEEESTRFVQSLPKTVLSADVLRPQVLAAQPPMAGPAIDGTQVIEPVGGLLPRVHLSFRSSADRFLVGRSVSVRRVPFLIGRSAQDDLSIGSDAALSREHAVIDWDGKEFTICDAGSRNGTYLNGMRLRPERPESLPFGAVIRLSVLTVLTFVSEDVSELPDLTDQIIGDRFRLTRLIRASVKGAIYEASDIRLPHKVAVKLLSPSLTRYPGYLKKFDREAEAAAALRHPHICRVLDHGQTSLRLPGGETALANYLCMELMDGGSLAGRLAAEGHIPVEQVANWLDALSDALQYVHAHGVFHSGLKPTSIVFDSEGVPYLTDFGLASTPEGREEGPLLGAPDFVAPEQWEGSGATAASDQYALGALTYFMLSGSRPYEGQDDPDNRQKNFARGPVPAHEQAARNGVGGLPPALSDALNRSLRVKPEDRFPSVRDFYLVFRQALSSTFVARRETPHVFVSYRRDLSAGWAVLFARELKEKHNIFAFVDTQRADNAIRVPAKVQAAIEDCDIFVCLLAKTTLRSAWVKEEIRLACEFGKPMVPVFQESFLHPSPGEQVAPHVLELLNFEGVYLLDRRNIHIDYSIAELARIVKGPYRDAHANGSTSQQP